MERLQNWDNFPYNACNDLSAMAAQMVADDYDEDVEKPDAASIREEHEENFNVNEWATLTDAEWTELGEAYVKAWDAMADPGFDDMDRAELIGHVGWNSHSLRQIYLDFIVELDLEEQLRLYLVRRAKDETGG